MEWQLEGMEVEWQDGQLEGMEVDGQVPQVKLEGMEVEGMVPQPVLHWQLQVHLARLKATQVGQQP